MSIEDYFLTTNNRRGEITAKDGTKYKWALVDIPIMSNAPSITLHLDGLYADLPRYMAYYIFNHQVYQRYFLLDGEAIDVLDYQVPVENASRGQRLIRQCVRYEIIDGHKRELLIMPNTPSPAEHLVEVKVDRARPYSSSLYLSFLVRAFPDLALVHPTIARLTIAYYPPVTKPEERGGIRINPQLCYHFKLIEDELNNWGRVSGIFLNAVPLSEFNELIGSFIRFTLKENGILKIEIYAKEGLWRYLHEYFISKLGYQLHLPALDSKGVMSVKPLITQQILAALNAETDPSKF